MWCIKPLYQVFAFCSLYGCSRIYLMIASYIAGLEQMQTKYNRKIIIKNILEANMAIYVYLKDVWYDIGHYSTSIA